MSVIATTPPQSLAAATPGSDPGVALPEALIPLRAAFGQDEANHGTVCYPVGTDGLVRVPLEAVGPLIARGGFALPDPVGTSVSAAMITLHHNDAAGCSYGGRQYFGDENGDVLVPAAAAAELSAHGFVPAARGLVTVPGRAKPAAGGRSRKG